MKPWDCREFVIIIYNTHFLLHNGCNLVQGMRTTPPWCLKQERPDGKWFYGFHGQRELPQWALFGHVFNNICQNAVCMVTCHQPISWTWVLKIFNMSWSSKYPCLKLLLFLSFISYITYITYISISNYLYFLVAQVK